MTELVKIRCQLSDTKRDVYVVAGATVTAGTPVIIEEALIIPKFTTTANGTPFVGVSYAKRMDVTAVGAQAWAVGELVGFNGTAFTTDLTKITCVGIASKIKANDAGATVGEIEFFGRGLSNTVAVDIDAQA